jgi:hypothetical protein
MSISPPSHLFHAVRTLAACGLLAIVTLAAGAASAQVNEVALTEKQVQGFIAAQKAISAATEKMDNATSNKPDSKIQGELEAIATRNGFKDFAEYDAVVGTIGMIMAGIDPQTKKFTDQQVAIKQEIAELEADKSLAADEKKKMLDELNEALRQAKPIRYPENIALVSKYYDKIEEVLE